MRIFITGGLGFIGSRLAVHLAGVGHKIILGSRKAIIPPSWLPQAKVVQTKWDDFSSLKLCCRDVDIVIHAAGMNAQDCAADSLAALAFNGLTTARLVNAAFEAGVERFIYLSTAHVYASPLVGTITENTCPRNLHPYATSHLAGENAVLGARQRGLINSMVLRISNAYGAPIHNDVNCWMLLVNDLCKQAVQTGKLVLHTSGQQQRDFIAMAEVCRFIEQLLDENVDNYCSSGIFNVGAGLSQSVLAMAQTIQKICVQVLGFEPELQFNKEFNEESPAQFSYQSNLIKKFTVKADDVSNHAEIEKLLRYCRTEFRGEKY